MTDQRHAARSAEDSTDATIPRRRFLGAAAVAAAGTGLASSVASAAPGDVAFAVNAGGSAYTAADGTDYRADTSYSGGSAAQSSDSIAGTDDDDLYRSERYGEFSYDIELAAGTYDVELHFAETYWEASGDRVFDVLVAGTEAVADLDIYAEVGHDAALVRTISGVDVSGGTLTISATGDVDNAVINAIRVVEATGDGSSGQQPYGGSAWTIPGRIEAEDYDTGGEGVAYHDTTSGNAGGAYRDDDVDIESATEGGYNVGWIVADEWLEYTVDVDGDDTYDLDLRVASASGGGQVRVEVDGTDVTGSIEFDATGGWQEWTTIAAGSVNLAAGQHVVRVYAETGDWNFNYLELRPAGDDAGVTYPDDPGNLDGRSWDQFFADHFDGDSLDTSVWVDQEGNGHDYGAPGWGNSEEQYYSQDNRWVENSNLVVEIREEQASDEHGTYDYTSGKLVTQGNLDFQYGRVDFRSKLVEDQGLWPAHWMLPAGDAAWPDDGEIDIMELVGNEPAAVHGTVHGPGYSGGGSIGGDYHLDSGVFADDFHVFSVVWDPGVIKWYVDGEHFFTVTREDVESGGNDWVFDDGPFWLILNCAVGGEWPGSPDETTTFPQRMEIDYVRLFTEA
ncbi:malectin domain-containing carbohydrate-binding protein [Natrialba sp. PRR66]|uniref:malectin domain-containing carbohydrate-binding protein n=1 Tax=Natrialba sp. PRR66 TaxID=3098146 RepID=UPI002B1E7967|nr:malectin domain-containing carbohydrate-binding protein [Natrialba sp. PRR66]